MTHSSNLLFLADTSRGRFFSFFLFLAPFPLPYISTLSTTRTTGKTVPHRYDVSRRRGNASALFRDLLASAPTTSSSSKLEDNVPLFFFILFVMPLAEGSVHGRASPVYVAGFFRGDCENEGLSQPSFCYSFALNLLSFFLK